jgi:enamine deaminase RidA (YjgF/YER057c/UK114 family)
MMSWHTAGRGVRPARRLNAAALLAMVAVLAAPGSSAAQDVRLRAIGTDDAARGAARAVVVEDGALVHTALLLSEDADGRLNGEGDVKLQASRVLENLQTALTAARTSVDHLVRLHVYLTDPSATPVIERLLAERFAGRHKPAVTFVETAPVRKGVLVAMDAIAATASPGNLARPERYVVRGLAKQARNGAHVAVQPPGPFAVVSGRAAQGAFESGIAGTMDQLRADLAGVGLSFDHVVQIKSFVGDISRADQLRDIVAGYFERTAPPQVVTEWLGAGPPAEIELIAAMSGAESADARDRTRLPPPAAGRGASGASPVPAAVGSRVTYVEPISSRYSRVAVARGGKPVFISGLYGPSSEPVMQVTEMFEQLRRLLQEAGSDLSHLVKATYYVSDKGADERINTIRPTLYNPERPPAASKITVRGTGRAGKGSTLDMIAVTADR